MYYYAAKDYFEAFIAVSNFDPYRKWLGIKSNRTPTYYQLLGISPREEDVQVIRRKAVERLRLLATIEDDKRKPLKVQLERRIKRAAKCLLDEQKRVAYDRKLLASAEHARSEEQGSHVQPDAQETTSPDGPFIAASQESIDGPSAASSSVSRSYQRQRRRSNLFWFYGLMAIVSMAGIGFLVVTQTSFGKSMLGYVRQAAKPVVSPSGPSSFDSDAEPLPMYEPRHPRQPSENLAEADEGEGLRDANTALPRQGLPETTVRPGGKAPLATDRAGMNPSPEEVLKLAEAMRSARAALESRNPEQAKWLLESVATLPKQSQHLAMYRRLELLTYYVNEYWKALDDAWNSLDSGVELTVDQRRLIVVEVDPDKLIVRYNGRNRTFTKHQLPSGLEVALADRWFREDAASTKVFRGAMMAVSPDFDDEQTREVWRQARQAGAELEDLEMVLQDNYDLMPSGDASMPASVAPTDPR